MAVIDLTENAGQQFQMASRLGSDIGNIVTGIQKRNKLAEEKEKKTLRQAATIKALNSGATGQELLNQMNQIPGAVEDEFIQSLNRKAIAQRASGISVDQNVTELQRLTTMRNKLHRWDGMQQQHVLVPGGEELLKGIDAGIKNTLERMSLSGQTEQLETEDPTLSPAKTDQGRDPATVKTGLTIEKRLEGAKQTQKRNFFDNTFEATEVMQALRDQAKTLVRSGVNEQTAKDTVLQQWQELTNADQGKFRKYPNVVEDDFLEQPLFDVVEQATADVQASLPRPTTQADFDAIPKGASFIDTDGKEKRKQ